MNYAENAIATKTEEVQHREGPIARSIERQTAKLPSDVFLWAAGAVIVGSLALEIIGMRQSKIGRFVGGGGNFRQPLAGFVGLWAPTLLLFGLYNKIVKVAGSDRYTR